MDPILSTSSAAADSAADSTVDTTAAADAITNPLLLKLSDLFYQFWQSEWKLIIVIVAAPLLQLFIKFTAPILIRAFLFSFSSSSKSENLNNKRTRTLASVITATSLVLIVAAVIWIVFSEFNINMTPIITGAGILSLAIGFGAQSLIKDVIAGVFIIAENQYNQGDWVKIDKFEGKVVEITLRRTVLQTTKGARHIIPNGQIKAVTNNTNQYNAISLDIPAKVDENFNKVNAIINRVGKKLAKDPKFKNDILEPPEAIGVTEINEAAAVIRVWGKAKPGRQVTLKRELANRIVKEFSEKNIKLPGKLLK